MKKKSIVIESQSSSFEEENMAIIRVAEWVDLPVLATLHQECFPDDARSYEEAKAWIAVNLRAEKRFSYFVVSIQGDVVGYILWMEKGGFRSEAVFELEQIGVASSQRGKGLGELLIAESLKKLKAKLHSQGRALRIVEVTTGASNEAQRLYRKTLGAEVEATLKDFFEGDEVIMVARNP